MAGNTNLNAVGQGTAHSAALLQRLLQQEVKFFHCVGREFSTGSLPTRHPNLRDIPVLVFGLLFVKAAELEVSSGMGIILGKRNHAQNDR